MASWICPIEKRLVPAFDRAAYKTYKPNQTSLPMLPHSGAFAAVRKKHIHEGVDLYCPEGTLVYPVERGIITAIIPFTGAQVGSPWWHDTDAVLVEGETGVVVYGEIKPSGDLKVGQAVDTNKILGGVTRVLTEDKGLPMEMLHIELRKHGTLDPVEWPVDGPKPDDLLDPTVYLLECTPRIA